MAPRLTQAKYRKQVPRKDLKIFLLDGIILEVAVPKFWHYVHDACPKKKRRKKKEFECKFVNAATYR